MNIRHDKTNHLGKAPQAIVGSAGKQHVKHILANVPRPDLSAIQAIREWASADHPGLEPKDILAVTLHYKFDKARGWLVRIAEQMTMTEALLTNWQDQSTALTVQNAIAQGMRPLSAISLLGMLPDLLWPHGHVSWASAFSDAQITIVEQLPKGGLLEDIDDHSVFHGLFHQQTPMRYDASTFVDLDAKAFQAFIWKLEFQDVFKDQLATFWRQSEDSYALAARIAFLAACNKQTLQGTLSESARQLAWRAAGVERSGVDSKQGDRTFEARMLNIHGYRSSNILCLTDIASQRIVLYIPGNASPLHEFASARQLRVWLALSCRMADRRTALLTHFCAQDIPDRLARPGLATVLQGLGQFPLQRRIAPATSVYRLVRYWNPNTVINYQADTYSPLIKGDVFSALAQEQRRRSEHDASFLITRDSEVSKATWRGYFYLTMNLLTPFMLVVPELIPLLTVAGAAQFGVGLDQAINDKHLEQQEDGAWQAAFGLLNAAPGITKGIRASRTLFGNHSLGFIKPVRVNGRVGYLLSPVGPPHLPEQTTLPYFQDLATVSEHTSDMGSEADPHVAAAVIRGRAFGTGDRLYGDLGRGMEMLVYDAQRDSFVLYYPDQARAGQDFIAQPDADNPQASTLVRNTEPSRQATPASRSRTLRALGVEITLPVDFEALGVTPGEAIPKRLFSIWVGDKVIAGDYLTALDHNIQVLRNSDYVLTLYLSTTNKVAYQQNMALLQSRIAGGLKVKQLESQGFYDLFKNSDYFNQYQAAIAGNGGVASNFSSASDILRYRILHSEGGIYLDMDDHLLLDEGPPPRARLDAVSLNATPDGLLLRSPVCNQQLGMYTSYNTSMIGSHAANPVLNDISDEILRRYQAPGGQEFYQIKPPPSDKAAYQIYTKKLNMMTGPGVLNHVIDQRLQQLRTFRNIMDLNNLPLLHEEALFDTAAQERAERRLLPLEQVIAVGNAQGY